MQENKDLLEQLSKKFAELSEKIKRDKELSLNEEQTKMYFIVPFFEALGYDFYNPRCVVPEYTADMELKKGEKVDYAILKDGKPFIIIEAKAYNENLANHTAQLKRYFGALKQKKTAGVEFGVLTNGAIYEFYTDIEMANACDDVAFLRVDVEHDEPILMAQKLVRFMAANIINVDIAKLKAEAQQQRYVALISEIYAAELNEPSDEFVKFFINKIGLLCESLRIKRISEHTLCDFKKLVKSSLDNHFKSTIKAKLADISKDLESNERIDDKNLSDLKTNKCANSLNCEFSFREAKMRYENDKFIVLAGSKIASEIRPSLTNETIINLIKTLQKDADGGILQDVEFKSSSAAASLISGASASGNEAWHNSAGQNPKEWLESQQNN